MTITKEEALKLLVFESDNIASLEVLIDSKLKEGYQSGKVFRIGFDELDNPSHRTIAELIRKYRGAGWQVGVDIDDIQGSSVFFH